MFFRHCFNARTTLIRLSLISIIFFSHRASAQKLVNTTGNTISDNAYIFEYSVGEISITTLTTTGNVNYITQGLLQPNVKLINPGCLIVNDTLNYFPNPTRNIL